MDDACTIFGMALHGGPNHIIRADASRCPRHVTEGQRERHIFSQRSVFAENGYATTLRDQKQAITTLSALSITSTSCIC